MIYDISGNALKSVSGDVNTVSVAAVNSTDLDKAKADYVCTGTNDHLTIQAAIDSLATKGGTVVLATGDYYLDGWNYDENGYKNCLSIKNGQQRNVKITGQSIPHVKPNSHDIGNTAILRLTDTAIDALTGNETRVSVIGYGGTPQRVKYTLDVSNIGIVLADNQHPIIAIDGKFFNSMYVSNVRCTIATSTWSSIDGQADYEYPVEDCIAIRGLEGSNAGAGYRISNCAVSAYGTAYVFNGEHLIAEQLQCRFCNYSYKFGYDATIGYNYHDLTLLNCCHELSSRYPAFYGNNAYRQAVNFYDYSVEHATSGKFATVSRAVEEHDGNHCGRVYFTVSYNNGNGSGAFFESGSGGRFEVVNTAYPS